MVDSYLEWSRLVGTVERDWDGRGKLGWSREVGGGRGKLGWPRQFGVAETG